jgi:CheY-like chemotaxis protein
MTVVAPVSLTLLYPQRFQGNSPSRSAFMRDTIQMEALMYGNCSVLHVEDDDADHVLFQRDLEKLRFTGKYVRVSSFEEAKQYVSRPDSDAPDLIIADSKLGIYNGLDIVQWAKAQEKLKETPVVVYSAAIAPHQRADVLSAGAAACLTKPIDSRETLTALEIILSYVVQRCRQK